MENRYRVFESPFPITDRRYEFSMPGFGFGLGMQVELSSNLEAKTSRIYDCQ
jgi:hypothetical protein